MPDCKPLHTPVAAGSCLSFFYGDLYNNPSLYHNVVSNLQHLTLMRPDITYTINQVCQFMHIPTMSHWAAFKFILHYLEGTITHGLFLRCGPLSLLHGFYNADWAGKPDDRCLISRYIIFF